MKYTLVIGDYAKSSWSMRAWLVMKAAGARFDTLQVRLEQPGTRARILECSPSAKVPVLISNEAAIGESLAIAETIAEEFPRAGLWPGDATLRAKARSACAEMHSGFLHLRTQLPFGAATGDRVDAILPDTRWEIDRVFGIWRDLRAASGSGMFLCGGFGIVDAMFAPVVLRLRRFDIDVPADLESYAAAVLRHPPVEEWLALAQTESRAS
jgi:glutathione S-transferase